MTQNQKKCTNQKAPAYYQDRLTRRPVESNHIPTRGTDWVSTRDQSHLASASSYLRTLYSIMFGNKNNTLFTKDAIFSPTSWDVAPIDTQYQYSSLNVYVNSQSCG